MILAADTAITALLSIDSSLIIIVIALAIAIARDRERIARIEERLNSLEESRKR